MAARSSRRRAWCPVLREIDALTRKLGGYERASGRRLRAFFGCLYCAVMRPGEALADVQRRLVDAQSSA
ncbi:hypothetical protein [Streptomyces sp. NPDC001020]